MATKTISVYGNTCISTSQYKWGSSSIYFDGNGDYLRLASGDVDFSGNFTLAWWMYPTNIDNNKYIISLVDTTSTGWDNSKINIAKGILNSNLNFYYLGTSIISVSPPSINTWTHNAIVRNGTSLKWYVGGSETTSATNSTNFNVSSVNFHIGNYSAGVSEQGFIGYLQGLEVSTEAKWTSNFTPPAAKTYGNDSTSLLLWGEGTNGSQTIVDSSMERESWTKFSKINGVTTSTLSKINGITKSTLKKVNGITA